MHKSNRLLKYLVVPLLLVVILLFVAIHSSKPKEKTTAKATLPSVRNTAANDSAAESLDTLTAELRETKQQVTTVSNDNQELKKQNTDLLNQLHSQTNETTAQLTQDMKQLKDQLQTLKQPTSNQYQVQSTNAAQPITTVTDVAQIVDKKGNVTNWLNDSAKNNNGTPTSPGAAAQPAQKKPEKIPYYTIPANSTSVRVRLMTALVGRIPVKGVVVDPYPFKLVFADDTLAASGWRVPHLRQMVVSGYCEGDWNLSAVRGWITSLTFVFDDGTITGITSNDNNIGEYTKNNALGYLTDARGNPIIGNKITDAATYLTGNVALGAAQGAANAYAQAQTTNQTSLIGTVSSVTGSPYKYVGGQAMSNAADVAQQWWHDREQNSFDAIFVSPLDNAGHYREITVNFAKEIPIDYNPTGRKITYENTQNHFVTHRLD